VLKLGTEFFDYAVNIISFVTAKFGRKFFRIHDFLLTNNTGGQRQLKSSKFSF